MSSWSKGYCPFNNTNISNKTGKQTIPIIQNNLPHSYVIMPALLSHIDSFSSDSSYASTSRLFQHQPINSNHHLIEQSISGKHHHKKSNKNSSTFKSSKEIIYTTKRMKTNKPHSSDFVAVSPSLTTSVNETTSFNETSSSTIDEFLEQQSAPQTDTVNLEPMIQNITYTQYQITTYDMDEKTPIETSSASNEVNTLSMINLMPSNPTTNSLVDQSTEYTSFFSSDSTSMSQNLTNSDDFGYESLIDSGDQPTTGSEDNPQTVTYAISFPSDWQYNIDTILGCYVLFKNLKTEANITDQIRLKCSVCKKEFADLNDLVEHKDQFSECKNNLEICSEETVPCSTGNFNNRKCSINRKSVDMNEFNSYYADEEEEEELIEEDCDTNDEDMSEENISDEDFYDELIESDDEISYFESNEQQQQQKTKLVELNQPTTRRKYTKNKNDPKNFSNLICEKCQKICRTRAEILVHRHKHAGKDPECWQCGKKCASFSNLISHVQLHTGEKPYTCQFCGKQFTQDAHLTRHIRLHTGERPFVCNICGKNYKDYSYYKTHLRIHRGERLYKCNFCNKEYYDASYYKKHTRLHTGEKPYMCTVCGRQFHRSDYLKLHSFSHTNERPFNCHICGKGFKMNYNLKLHLKNHDHEQSQINNRSTISASLSVSSNTTESTYFNDPILISNSNSFINTDNLVEQSSVLANTTTINLLSSSVSNEMVSFLSEDRNLEFLSK